MTELYSSFVHATIMVSSVKAWGVCNNDVSGHPCMVMRSLNPPRLMTFARKVDADMAIRGLKERGIRTIDDINKFDREEIYRICIESLAW